MEAFALGLKEEGALIEKESLFKTFPFFSFPMKLRTQQSRNHCCKALDILTFPSIVDFIDEVYYFLTFLPSLYSQNVLCFSPSLVTFLRPDMVDLTEVFRN